MPPKNDKTSATDADAATAPATDPTAPPASLDLEDPTVKAAIAAAVAAAVAKATEGMVAAAPGVRINESKPVPSEEVARALQLSAQTAKSAKELVALAQEPVVVLNFPRDVLLTLKDHSRALFKKGYAEVPISLAGDGKKQPMNDWLRRNGVTVVPQPAKAAAKGADAA